MKYVIWFLLIGVFIFLTPPTLFILYIWHCNWAKVVASFDKISESAGNRIDTIIH